MSCARHKDVPTEVSTPRGQVCAWCRVGELQRLLDVEKAKVLDLELALARSQGSADEALVRVSRAMAGGA